jgi:hypothetical protein
MTGKDAAKLGAAVAIIALAVVLYVVRSRSADSEAEEGVTYWYCTTAQKYFELKGEEQATRMRMAHAGATSEPGGDGVALRRRSGGMITQAMSPFSKDWTGVPALKCEDCGEVFALDTDRKTQSICPKCQWNPATRQKGVSQGGPPQGAQPDE